MMNYQQITLKTKLLKINQEDCVIDEVPISGFRLLASYDGRTELPKLEDARLQIYIRSGFDSCLFELDKEGNILETNHAYMFSMQLAKEELIITKTKLQDEYSRTEDMDV